MRQIEVVDSGVESHWEGRCHEVLPIVTRWAWHRRLTRGRGATSSAGVTGRGNIALFLDSGIWQGLEGCPKGAFIFTTPHAKIQLLHKQHDTATLVRGGANRACCTSRFPLR